MTYPRTGFSLVELSIVLVILGLLVGGILAGQSLIRASQLRSVAVEYDRYRTATLAFRDKYFAIPGDFSNATGFWGKDDAYCAGDSGTASATGTCNGDGNARLSPGSASTTGEILQFWRQLALAGLIDGNYTGIAGPSGGLNQRIGENVPASKLAGAGWGVSWRGGISGNATYFDGSYDHPFSFGANSRTENDLMNNSVL